MLQYIFRPLDMPPNRWKTRKGSQFRAKWSDTLELLERELKHLRATNIILQADVELSDVRLDGMLRAQARPKSPAVAVTFDSMHGPLSYPCDTYSDWQDNIRAIAMSLQSLRAVDRYGVTKRAEQYKGWQKLPPPPSQNSTAQYIQTLLIELSNLTGIPYPEVRDNVAAAIKTARIKHHPDRGGDPAISKRIGEIAGALGL